MPPVALRPIPRAVVLPCIWIQASSFASSSRVRLDFTSPRRADPPRVNTTLLEPIPRTTTDSPPHQERKPSPGVLQQLSSPTPPRIPPRITTTPNASSITKTPLFQSTKTSPSKPRKGEPIPLRYAPEDTSTNNQSLTHTLTITSSRNNVILTFTDQLGPLFGTITGGTGGIFKKSNRNSYEAAYQAALKMISKIVEYSRDVPRVRMRVAFKGMFGQGREAVALALGGNEGVEIRSLVGRVEDKTPYVITGTRSRSRRRV